jgi:RimJ/RimL family protein N-acetyltransferase
MLVRDLEATQAFCEQWSGLDLKRLATLFLQFQQSRPVALPRIDQLQLVPIDRTLFETSPAVNLELIREEIAWMWPSEMRFLSHGFGVAALAGDDIICWCTAEYLSARQCGVGITTDPAYEGQGVATATAARFVEECARRGILPRWECARDNVGSRRVAEKVGFGLISEEEYFGGSFIAQRPS